MIHNISFQFLSAHTTLLLVFISSSLCDDTPQYRECVTQFFESGGGVYFLFDEAAHVLLISLSPIHFKSGICNVVKNIKKRRRLCLPIVTVCWNSCDAAAATLNEKNVYANCSFSSLRYIDFSESEMRTLEMVWVERT